MSLLLAAVFLLGNAFFVGAQFALVTTRSDQLEPLAGRGTRGARSALAQSRSLPRMLAGSQLGIAACSLGLGAVAEPAFAHGLEALADDVHLSSGVVTGVALVLALVFVSFCHMVLGERVPKNLALAGPVRAALLLAPPMGVWLRATRPLLVVINAVADAVVRAVGLQPKSELGATYTAEDLAALFDESHAEGLLDVEERDRLLAAARLDRMTVADLTIPLDRTVTITGRTTVSEVERLAATTHFLRFPLRDGDSLGGYVNAKDLLDVPDDAVGEPIGADFVRPLPVVQCAQPVGELLRRAPHGELALCEVRDGERLLGVMTLDDALRAVAGG